MSESETVFRDATAIATGAAPAPLVLHGTDFVRMARVRPPIDPREPSINAPPSRAVDVDGRR